MSFICQDSASRQGCVGVRMSQCNKMDVHWRPFYARCHYCEVDYDYIGRMEDFDEGLRYIAARKNLTNLIDLSERLNSVEEVRRMGHTTEERIKVGKEH